MYEPISIRLLKTLLDGKARLTEDSLSKIIGFVESQRTEEYSFKNKSGQADIYYTLFGWMLSYILGIGMEKRKTAGYLTKQKPEEMDFVHYSAYMRCSMIKKLFERGKAGLLLNIFYSDSIKEITDFSIVPNNDMQSPYSQFLWLSLMEDTRNRIKNKEEILGALERYRTPDGGYMNTINGKSASTNATVSALIIKGQLEGYKPCGDIDYLKDMQEKSGGFSAAEKSPIPDMLSTATSLLALNCYGVKPKFPPENFIEAHWLDSGGFSATLLEDKSDIEYTFYGLLALGAL